MTMCCWCEYCASGAHSSHPTHTHDNDNHTPPSLSDVMMTVSLLRTSEFDPTIETESILSVRQEMLLFFFIILLLIINRVHILVY